MKASTPSKHRVVDRVIPICHFTKNRIYVIAIYQRLVTHGFQFFWIYWLWNIWWCLAQI